MVLNMISRYLPLSRQLLHHASVDQLTCRDELSFLSVFAHPKLSNRGLVAKTISLIPSIPLPVSPPDTAAMYCMILLAASVFPAPDSPEMITHWFSFSVVIR
jgi:hypothetical protein